MLLSTGACEPSGSPSAASEGDKARAAGQQVSVTLAARAFRPACGTAPPAPGAQPDLAMLVTVPHAMSCRDLGFTLRRLPAERKRSWVVVPEADTIALCAFLRTERVRLPVMAIQDSSATLSATRLVVAVMRETGGTDRHLYAPRGAHVLRQMGQEAGTASSAVP